jgi:hypothetical protein
LLGKASLALAIDITAATMAIAESVWPKISHFIPGKSLCCLSRAIATGILLRISIETLEADNCNRVACHRTHTPFQPAALPAKDQQETQHDTFNA